MHLLASSEQQTTETTLFLQTLKASTSDNHLRLESNGLLSSLMLPGLSLRQYQCYLILMQNIQLAYERRVPQEFASLIPEWHHRKASVMIAEDLSAINYHKAAKKNLVDFEISQDTAMPGFMYVMEGSRLGGMVIYKNIHRNLGLTEKNGGCFLAGGGYDTGALWKQFTSNFSAFVVANQLQQSTLDGANEAFNAIYNYFESNRNFYEI